MKIPVLAVVVGLLATSVAAQNEAQELEALKKRVTELEDTQSKHGERLGDRALVGAFSAKSLDLGGELSSLFTWIHGEADDEVGHMVSLVELFVKAELDDHWSAFAVPGFYTFNGALLDNPATPTTAGDPTFTADESTTARTFLSRLYAEWRHGDRLTLRGGIVGSPHGTTNREYFIPARQIAQASLHTRYFLGNTLYPQVVEGVRASGKLVLGEDWLDCDAYFGVEDDSADDAIGGARIGYVFADWGLTVAANYGQGTRQPAASPLTNFGILQAPFAGDFFAGRDYQLGGLDFDLRKGDLIAKTELYYSAEDGFVDQRAASSEWTWFVCPCWGLTYRFDFYDAGSDVSPLGPVAPLGIATEHVVGLSFDPNPSVRLRLDVHHGNLPNTDDTVDYVNISWSISF
ncbi:MAG: TonB-dependent receptor [Planctomycetota bacterium]